ncbi:sensor histidine kinase [Petropleomorpha daqingensis]|uniref:histidine kinase n=1 Tax=Petropleomorpha daqingensis TaxID=2026353 RepID=A0A853CC00_9ACTN|nr:sensor histidine kinase [Petropleomorpha daqingensis]NYJ04152.1 signal transduction histidine kinase [Petropleomorpha daqingensis]
MAVGTQEQAPLPTGDGEPRRPDLLWDVALAVALTVFAQLDLRLDLDNSTPFGPSWAVAVCTLVATGALAFRRRAPLATALTVAAAVAGPELFTVLTITLWGDFVPMLVAAYSVARHADRQRAAAGVLAIATAVVVLLLRVPSIGAKQNIPFAFVPLVLVTLAGRVLRRRQLSHAALSLQATRLAEDQEAWVRDAVAAERARIARELHDVVAHCVSVMVIQAGAAEDLLDRDPGAARQPLRAVQDTGQEAVAELGRMLGLLRAEAAPDTLLPQPGVAQLPELVAQVRAAGLPVDLDVQGEPHDLPPGVDVALYRLTQEALTNALKHARGARATVVLRCTDTAVELRVHDDGRGTPAGTGLGHGLIGMRERVALYGGTLSAGPRDHGGFAVDAVIPLGAHA